jgi:hypothetical protein
VKIGNNILVVVKKIHAGADGIAREDVMRVVLFSSDVCSQ